MADKEKGSKTEEAGKGVDPQPSGPGTGKVTEISRSSISALGSKIDEFSEKLSEDERVTLATVFALAGRGFGTFVGPVSCAHDLRVGIGQESISVERISGGSVPKLSDAFADAFCPGKVGRFSIEGLEVERPMIGAKSVAAAGAKSVAAGFCRTPGYGAAKSVAAGFCRTPGYGAAKSVAAGFCRTPGFAAAKSVAAASFCRNPGQFAAKSVAARACRFPGFGAAKSVAAAGFCRTPGFAAAKSVAAASFCRNPGQFAAKSVAARACRFPGFGAAKSVAAACRYPGYYGF